MDVSHPFESLLPAADSAVLAVLAGSTRPRTGREIAREAGRSHPAVQRILNRLVEQGLVERQRAGRSFIYALNRDHLAAPAIEALSSMRPELFAKLRELIQSWETAPEHASVFGSAARGDGSAESDIDIFLVRTAETDADDPIWQAQVDHLARAVRAWTGNHAGISEISVDEIPRLAREGAPVIDDLVEDSVELAGKSVRQLLPRS